MKLVAVPLPYRILIAVVVALVLVGGGYWWGHAAAATSCAAKAGKGAAKAETAEDLRDANVDAITAAAVTAIHAAQANTQGNAYESAERIRTVVVPGPCRTVDPVIVRELDEATCRINAKIRGGVRPGAADACSAAAAD